MSYNMIEKDSMNYLNQFSTIQINLFEADMFFFSF